MTFSDEKVPKKAVSKPEIPSNQSNFNVRKLGPGSENVNDFPEKVMKKTVDASQANDENSHNNKNSGKKQQKDNCEDSNEILEEIELNNIADDIKDADNAVLEYKNSDFLKEPEINENIDKNEKSAPKNQVSLKELSKMKELENNSATPKVQEIDSITIEIRSKNVREADEKQSKPNSSIISPPSVSSSDRKNKYF